MVDSPADILATAALLLAIGTSIGVVLYTISLILRANQQADTPEETLETLAEAIRTLGRTSDILTNAIRGLVTDTVSTELASEKPITTPTTVVIEKATVIFKKPPKERTDEDYAFLEHYVTPGLLRTMFNLGNVTAEEVDRFAVERHTPPETRKRLLTTLLETKTSDNTDDLQAVPHAPNQPADPPFSQHRTGRHAANDAAHSGRIVATGRVLIGAIRNGSAPQQSSPQ